MLSPPVPSYLAPPRHEVLPQHPILEHPQPMFLPRYQRSYLRPDKTGKITAVSIITFMLSLLLHRAF
jgi:hypothetical protein